ncbi:MAG TPA: HEAT repeat domain-containing protein [Verrucomicrobiae bacterium]|nr:HEAT repeat domain-containing protein [Verrucomicrobiae bacterium]
MNPKLLLALALVWNVSMLGFGAHKNRHAVPNLVVLVIWLFAVRLQSSFGVTQDEHAASPPLSSLSTNEAGQAVPGTIITAQSTNVDQALYGISKIAEAGQAAAPALIKMVQDKSQPKEVRLSAAYALDRVYPRDPDALPAYVELLKEHDPDLRDLAITTLGTFHEKAVEAMPVLMTLYQTSDEQTRLKIIECWDSVGPSAVQAAPQLAQALRDTKLRVTALGALGRMGRAAQEAIPSLLNLLRDEALDNRARYMTADALSVSLPNDTRSVSIFIDLMKDKDAEIRVLAVRAIADRGANAAEAVPALMRLYQTENLQGRLAIIYCLGAIGPHAESAVPLLTSTLQDQSRSYRNLVRDWGAVAVGKIGPGAKDAAPGLVALLHDPEYIVRMHAADALGRLGAVAIAAVPDLKQLLVDPDENVRRAARSALKRIATSE